jgi:hypothetical protein
MIANQLGRRNLTPEQKSYLRGKRYNLEKKAHGGDRRSEEPSRQNDDLKTAERLSEEYGVSRDTIEQDAQFAEATDTLEAAVGKDIREMVLKRQKPKGQKRTTKGQVVKAGRAIKERRVTPMPFMRRAAWKDYQVIEAIDLIAEAKLPPEEQASLNALLDRPHIPAEEGIQIIRNLVRAEPEQRRRIFALQASDDPRERSLALTLAARKAPALLVHARGCAPDLSPPRGGFATHRHTWPCVAKGSLRKFCKMTRPHPWS